MGLPTGPRYDRGMVFFRTSERQKAVGTQLPGRDQRAFPVPERHAVLGHPLEGPYPDGIETAYLALGCFWGAERLYWRLDGVWTTAVGYQNGTTPNPTYEEVCSGATGHAETVLVAFDPNVVSYAQLLEVFFTEHDPTQGMRQGNDVGTQYRSGIFTVGAEQAEAAERIRASYGRQLEERGLGPITTTIEPAAPFYFAEPHHQQYLHKVPNGYCGLAGTGVACQAPAA